MSNLYYNDKIIMKASSVENNIIYGYNILTEEFCAMKLPEMIPMNDMILKIVTDEYLRVLIVARSSKTRKEFATILGCGERKAQRLFAKYNLADEQRQERAKNLKT